MVITLLLASAFTFVVAELAYRVYCYGPGSLSITGMNSVHHLGEAGVLRRSEFPDLIYEFEPNLDTWYKLTPFRTNSRGLRDREYALEKPPGTSRIAVVGASISIPSGVAIEDAYHSLIEDRLNAEFGAHRKFEAINFACGGYALSQSVAMVRHRVLAYSPDAILLGFSCTGDAVPETEEHLRTPYQTKPASKPFWSSALLRDLGIIPVKRDPERDLAPPLAERLAYSEIWLRELGQICAENHIPCLVAFLGLRSPDTELPELEQMVRRCGLDFVDACIRRPERELAQYYIYRKDQHPNAAANRVFADLIYPWFVKSGAIAR